MAGYRVILGCLLTVAAVAQQTATPPPQPLRSHMWIYRLSDRHARQVFQADAVWEAPTWSPGGKYLIANSGGTIYRMDLQPDGTLKPQRLQIPPEYRCNNDKGLSPDGKLLAFSATKAPAKGSNVYLANADGTNIRPLTTEWNSYFHGFTPNGKAILFVAQRNGSKQFDLYSLPLDGGPETRLTTDEHHDDGPDVTPDGHMIYFNSDRTGQEAIWRMPITGAGPGDERAEKIIADGNEDWFPHLSPDGKILIYIAYPKGTATHNPRTLQVQIMGVPLHKGTSTSLPKALVTVTGGQGTINVNSWSPDSRSFAYVTYEPIP